MSHPSSLMIQLTFLALLSIKGFESTDEIQIVVMDPTECSDNMLCGRRHPTIIQIKNPFPPYLRLKSRFQGMFWYRTKLDGSPWPRETRRKRAAKAKKPPARTKETKEYHLNRFRRTNAGLQVVSRLQQQAGRSEAILCSTYSQQVERNKQVADPSIFKAKQTGSLHLLLNKTNGISRHHFNAETETPAKKPNTNFADLKKLRREVGRKRLHKHRRSITTFPLPNPNYTPDAFSRPGDSRVSTTPPPAVTCSGSTTKPPSETTVSTSTRSTPSQSTSPSTCPSAPIGPLPEKEDVDELLSYQQSRLTTHPPKWRPFEFWGLEIRRVTDEDFGIYIAVLEYGSEKKAVSVKLNITNPPVLAFTTLTRLLNPPMEGSGQVWCGQLDFVGDPPIQAYWKVLSNDTVMSASFESDGFMKLKLKEDEDPKDFECRVRNVTSALCIPAKDWEKWETMTDYQFKPAESSKSEPYIMGTGALVAIMTMAALAFFIAIGLVVFYFISQG